MFKDKLFILLGNKDYKNFPKQIFDKNVVNFLDELSKTILKNKNKILFPEIISFGFWCRKKNIVNLKHFFKADPLRIGKGSIFHIAPKNVPINFAYSLAVGLLAGNHNIVRVHSVNCDVTNTVCDLLKHIMSKKIFSIYKNYILILSYESSSNLTDKYSLECDSRIIWGGDKTVNTIKSKKTKTDCIDISFPDRFSMSIINLKKINQLNLKEVALRFYNDVYIMDQAACSSPHLIIWLNYNNRLSIINKFWDTLFDVVKKKYKITDYIGFNKFEKSNENLILLDKNVVSFKNYSNLIHVTNLKNLKYNIDEIRGSGGSFYSVNLSSINMLKNISSNKFQTLTYYGLEKKFLLKILGNNFLLGINRACPVGRALSFSPFWDGKDLIRSLSKIIIIE